MSAISGFINTIRNAVCGEQVRGAIISALEACYSDVESPSLNQAAFTAAIEAAYAGGILDIITVTQISAMTNQNIIYRYNGTEAGKQKGLYYYSALSSSWVLIGSEIHSVSLMSRMTDTNSLYKYTGTETGKQKGIYYHNGTDWEFLGGGVQAGTIDDMTNPKMLYLYTGTNPKMIPNALYYYNGTEWVPVGKLPSTEEMETVTVVPRWEIGAIGQNGVITGYSTRTTHNEYIEVKAGAVVSVDSEATVKFGIATYTESKVFLEIVKNITDSALTYTVTKDCLIRVWAGYNDDSTLADNFAAAELGAKVSITTPTAIKFQPTTVGMEYGYFDTSTGENRQDKTYLYQRSQKVINVHGQKVIKVKFPSEIIQTVDTIWVFSYNKNKTPLGTGRRLYRIKSKELEQVLILPDNAYYIRFFAAWESAHYNYEPVTVSAAVLPTEECLFSTGTGAIKISYTVSGNNVTGGTLRLPPNYTSDGKSVPLIVCAGGSDWYPEFDSGLASSASPIWNYSPYITPVNLLCYLKGIEYVCSRYNVDINKVFLCCISQGGEFGLWAIMQETTNIKAVSFLSTGNNICKFSSGGIFIGKTGRTAMNKVMHLDGTQEEIEAFINTDAGWQDSDILAFCRRNINQFIATVPWAQGISGTDADEIFDLSLSKLTEVPQWMIDKGVPSTFVEPPAAFVAREGFAKYAHVPSKFWGSYDDEAVCMHNNYAIYQWLMNGASDTEFRQLPDGTGGHYSAIGFNNSAALKSSGTTALGIAYTNVPTALVETVAFFHDKICDL